MRLAILLLLIACQASSAPIDAARARVPQLRATFAEKGLRWPPAEIHLRVFKADDVLELWARDAGAAFVLAKTFPICARSGSLGPKRREGDGQVPEGVYRIDRFNAQSNFHLSLGLDYPNASDRLRGARPLGGDIFIHGSCVTIGCVPIEDGPVEELFAVALAARDAGQKHIAVHVFPARLDDAHAPLLARAAAADPALAAFWQELRPIHDAFERTRRVPRVRIAPDGRYVLAEGK